MRFITASAAIFLLVLFGSPVLTQAQDQAGAQHPDLELPQVASAAQLLRETLRRDFQWLRDNAATEELTSRDTLLKSLQRAQRNYNLPKEITALERLVGSPYGTAEHWADLSQAYQRAGRGADSLHAAYIAYLESGDGEAQAKALALLSEALEAQGDWRTAIKVLEAIPEDARDPQQERRIAEIRQRHGFQLKDVEVDVDRAVAEACFVFTENLAQPLPLPAGDYVTLAPETKVNVTASGERLCLTGLRHGEEYQVTLRAGIPSTFGQEIEEESQHELSIGQRPPEVRLSAGSYLLPRSADPTIPITTINADKVDLRLLRINDRNLIAQILGNRIGAPLNRWEESNISDQSGEQVWAGVLTTEGGEPNRETTTLVPLTDILAATEPGIYLVTARPRVEDPDSNYRPPYTVATQWLIISDLGLTAFQGEDGLQVFVRSLETAQAAAEVKLQLIARNNAVLGQGATGPKGQFGFAPGLLRGAGGNRPAALLAETTAGDFAFLSLISPALDLSERGVEGRAASGPVDAFLYSERGVYRPGETVHLAALLRNTRAFAETATPMILRVFRTDGLEVFKETSQGDGLGGHVFEIPLTPSAPTGLWTASAFTDPSAAPVGSVTFQVEDFVPQRLELKLSSEAKSLRPDAEGLVEARGRYLYGAAAADLPVAAEALIDVDPDPYPAYAGYRFGLVDEDFRTLRQGLRGTRTDATGTAALPLRLERGVPNSSHPLAVTVRVSLFDQGGRPVTRLIKLPIRARELQLGLKPRFSGDQVGNQQPAEFDVVALDPDGQPLADREVSFRWLRVLEDYVSYWNNGWRWRRIASDQLIDQGTVSLDPDGAATLSRAFDWGKYRLEVYDPASGAAASIAFTSGWWARPNVAATTPDALEVSLDRQDYKAGERLRAFIKAPFAGQAMVAVVSDRLHHIEEIQLPEAGREVEIPVSADWGPGAYLTASAYRPLGQNEAPGSGGLLPTRAMGTSWFTVDRAARTLDVALDLPAEVRPRQSIEIPVQVSGAKDIEVPVHLTLAAVDDGILLLTDFAAPDPTEHYFGQRQLGVDIRDLYGRLIRPAGGLRGTVRSGGDTASRNANLAGLRVRTTKAVSIFQGPIRLRDDGTATVRLELPDFNGRLRIMAVAYSRDAVGKADGTMLVRDPVVAELVLPRFLAPADLAQATLSLHNLAGPAGDYAVEIETDGAVGLAQSGMLSRTLAPGDRATLQVALAGNAAGTDELRLTLTGPEDFVLRRSWDIEVRAAQPYQTQRLVTWIGPGESLTLGSSALADYLPGTESAGLGISIGPDFDVPALLASLQRYPYGCVEQTISRGLPLLYLVDAAKDWDYDLRMSTFEIKDAVRFAIRRTVDRQRPEGSFGLWTVSSPGQAWLSAYAMDFLTRAREQGYVVPETAYQNGMRWLHRYVGQRGDPQDLPGQAYALHVLSRAGQVDAGTVRYFAERNARLIPTALGRAQLATTLMSQADPERATALLRSLGARWREEPLRFWDYGSELRDGAFMVAALAEAGEVTMALDLADEVAELYDKRRYLSTQEQVWLLLASRAIATAQGTQFTVGIDDETLPPRSSSLQIAIPAERLHQGVTVRNEGAESIRIAQSLTAVPAGPLPAEANDLQIERLFFTLEGEPLDPTTLRQNELAVVFLRGRVLSRKQHQALIVDLLPAGFEIENVALARGRGMGDISFLPELTETLFESRRDDRYIAAVDLDGGRNSGWEDRPDHFHLAYLVRAVTPGDYVLPAPYVEDMYKPYYFARGEVGRAAVLTGE